MKKSLIYTKSGDKGKTSLVGGTRVSKSHIRLDAYGTIDELNSFVGWLNCSIEDRNTNDFLAFLQHKLFNIGSYLATETESINPKNASLISQNDIEKIEHTIDELDSHLPRLKQFVLPGGNEAASRAHICRTIVRRAERNAYRLTNEYPVDDSVLIFLNRLSDYFFILARTECIRTSEEIFWKQDSI